MDSGISHSMASYMRSLATAQANRSKHLLRGEKLIVRTMANFKALSRNIKTFRIAIAVMAVEQLIWFSAVSIGAREL